MNIKTAAGVAALLLATFGPAAHAANLVTNGDFSSSSYTQNHQFGLASGGQGVTGWTGNNGYDIYFFGGTATTVNTIGQYTGTGNEKLYSVPASMTGNFVALDGEQTSGVQGSISQNITGLIHNTAYQLSFDWGAGQLQSRTGATTETLDVSIGGFSFVTPTLSNPSNSATDGGLQTFSFFYTGASSITNVLTFLSVGTPTGLPPIATIDNVSLTAVPEPAAFGLLGLGLVGLVAARRRT
jgi:PEP-CTERM motif